jgi:hypothetical protein
VLAFRADAVNVTVAYQTSAEPAKVAQADNSFAKESGCNCHDCYPTLFMMEAVSLAAIISPRN